MFENFWLTLLSNAIYCFSLMSGQFLYSPIADARKKYLWRLLGCIFVNAVVIVAVTLFDQWQLDHFNNNPLISSYVLTIIAIASVCVCYKSGGTRTVYSVVAGLMLMQIYMQPAKILQNFTNVIGVNPLISAMKIASWLIFYSLLYLFFIRRIANDSEFRPTVRQVITLSIFAFVVLYSTMLESVVFAADKTYYVMLCIGETILCIVVLYMHYSAYLGYQKEKQKAVELELERQANKQFEKYEQIIDVLNVKCHDLKHQIREIGGKNSLSPEVIEELNKTAELYDSFVKTGNATIDTVLTEKSLRCEASGIQMTCMLDGSGLSYMSPYDINALFGNALDNAIQCEEKVDVANRYVSITCKPMQDMIHIHIMNYVETAPNIGGDGLPVTTGDKNYHGFGMKSMKQTVEKYGGSLRVTVEGNTFSLDILLPYRK